ncbi:MAG TPA: phage major capsid protein [Actinomycetota bacterium]|nr:phage major capsid protein [Actinomycetota bacterium]
MRAKVTGLPARAAEVIGYTAAGRPVFPIAGGDGTDDDELKGGGTATLIAELRSESKTRFEALEAMVREAKKAGQVRLTDEQQAQYDTLREEMQTFDGQVLDLSEHERAERVAADAARKTAYGAGIRVTEPRTYSSRPVRNEDGSWRSYFSDVYKAQRNHDVEAFDRLRRHAKEQAEEIQARMIEADRAAEDLYERQLFRTPDGRDIEFVRRQRMITETRDITRVDGAGGEFVPPLWLVDQYAGFARAARVFADAYNVRPLPPGTDSINVPRITTGTATAAQTADNAAVSEQDMVTATLTVPIRTIAGQQDVAIQLLEQSPIAFDEVVFTDLIADYNAQVDVNAINGSGAAGQILGLLQLAGINAVTYTDATPTVPELYPKIADSINQSATNRKLPPTRIFMAPRRWFWHTAALDSNNRPLVVPIAGAPFNSMARVEDVQAEGPVGQLQGLPVFIDPNIPITLGAGTNEDRVIVSRFIDHWLWESFLRTRILPEVLSQNLTVRLQVYSYVAATAGRYPAASSVVSGTGLITPTF